MDKVLVAYDIQNLAEGRWIFLVVYVEAVTHESCWLLVSCYDISCEFWLIFVHVTNNALYSSNKGIGYQKTDTLRHLKDLK